MWTKRRADYLATGQTTETSPGREIRKHLFDESRASIDKNRTRKRFVSWKTSRRFLWMQFELWSSRALNWNPREGLVWSNNAIHIGQRDTVADDGWQSNFKLKFSILTVVESWTCESRFWISFWTTVNQPAHSSIAGNESALCVYSFWLNDFFFDEAWQRDRVIHSLAIRNPEF